MPPFSRKPELSPLQVIAEEMTQFQRVELAFNAMGWDLYLLHGRSCMAVHRAWGVSAVCPTLGNASELLRRIRGSA
jgi:hypothetical protein